MILIVLLLIGKYSSKKESFFEDIEKWQKERGRKKIAINPIQFTFEITNKCNCHCKDCGMSANSITNGKTVVDENELFKIVDDLYAQGIPAVAITGGEPFLQFKNMCKMMEYAKNKIDINKIISNGFWGKDAKKYFDQMVESGLLENQFFIPAIQISIGEQDVPLEYVCNIIHYVTEHFRLNELKLGIIHTRLKGESRSKLSLLYQIYLEKYGEFPKGKVYLTDSYYVNSNVLAKEKIDTYVMSVYDAVATCDNRFGKEIGRFVSPKIFMKCNGDCYPCEVFNMHKDMYLGNYFELGLESILKNLNSNKYVKFIKKYGTIGFREVIPDRILKSAICETSCYGCEFCIKLAEKNHLIR